MNEILWNVFDNGRTIGSEGSENGIIVRDEEHTRGARITLERNSPIAPFAISCGIYGWMFHTRFSSTESDALREFDEMKDALGQIIAIIPSGNDSQAETKSSEVSEALQSFVEKYP